LWPVARSDESPLRLRVLGPPGAWTLDGVRGADASATKGEIPGEVIVTPAAGPGVDFDIRLRDGGGRRFGYSRFFAPIDWRVRFYDFRRTPDAPSSPAAFAAVLAAPPLADTKTDRLDYLSSRAIADGVPDNYVALTAEAEASIPAGRHALRVISDEGVRVWIDGALAIDNWTPHESVVDEAPIPAGRRRLRVEYFERTGFAELRVEIVKADERR
jgi:hypothetical protein